MPEFDVVIRGGKVVDGTGRPARVADVAISGSSIAKIGRIGANEAARSVDAGGKIVAPGFIDIHTHYDAQLLWDSSASPTISHGVTTVSCGNCGYTLAPVTGDDVSFLSALMARVEGIPLGSLRSLDWSWRSYGDYLERIGAGVGPNVGFLVGHSAIRRTVMGAAATTEAASDEQIDAMADEVRKAVAAGARGFSSSQSPIHFDGAGDPVPSRAATPDELVRLCAALTGTPASVVEFIPPGVLTELSPGDCELMAAMAAAAGVPLNWNTLSVDGSDLDKHLREIENYTNAASSGPEVLGLILPMQPTNWISFATGVTLKAMPGWKEVFEKDTVAERMRVLLDPNIRDAIRNAGRSAELGNVGRGIDWSALVVAQVESPKYRALLGRTVGEAAAELGTDALDLVIEIAVADELRAGFTRSRRASDEVLKTAAAAWHDDRTVLGASDAGAHLDIQAGGTFTTDFLSGAVRDRELMTVEEAIRQITDVPGRLYRFDGRGRLAEGWSADVVVLDLDRLTTDPISSPHDFPAGGSRVYAEATGYEHVFVNGVEALADDQLTGAVPGSVLKA